VTYQFASRMRQKKKIIIIKNNNNNNNNNKLLHGFNAFKKLLSCFFKNFYLDFHDFKNRFVHGFYFCPNC